jgi:hypothetical protein
MRGHPIGIHDLEVALLSGGKERGLPIGTKLIHRGSRFKQNSHNFEVAEPDIFGPSSDGW